jgi:uncharacterized protein with PIN domain
MGKKNVMITMDEDLHKKAKEKFLNISAEAEKAIRERLGKAKVEINQEITNCEFCDREMRKATAKDLNGLCWVYPDEKWICPKCLKVKSLRESYG